VQKTLKNSVVTLLFLFCSSWVTAQNIVANPISQIPSESIACGDAVTLKFRLYGPTLANEKVSVQLPVESEFLSMISPGSGVSVNSSNVKNPIFNINAALVTTSDYIDIAYSVQTGCSIMNSPEIYHELVSNSSINKLVDYPSVQYSVLEISNTIMPASATLTINQPQNFTFTVENNPVSTTAYTKNIIAEVTHTTNVEITYSGTGTFTSGTPSGGMVTDIITLDATQISTIGNNNNRFEKNESIAITVVAKLLGCPSGGGETISYRAGYGGCLSTSDVCLTGNSSTSGIALQSGTPDLYTNVVKKAWPNPTNSDTAEFLLRNDGTGFGHIYNLTYNLGFSNGGAVYTPTDINRYDWSNFKVNGNTVANNGSHGSETQFQFSSDPDGSGVGLEDLDGDGFFDDLPVGNSFVLETELAYNYLLDTNNNTTCVDMYVGYATVRWNYTYEDQCGNSTSYNVPNRNLGTWRPWSFYSVQHTGQNINSSTGDSNFGSGDTFDFNIDMRGAPSISELNIPGLHYEVHYTLPQGVIPNGNGTWSNQPFNLKSFNAATGIAIYTSQSATTRGYYLGYDHKIPLKIDPACSGSFVGNISYEHHLIGDATYEPIVECGDGPMFTVSCGSSGPSVCVSNFSFDRTNFGFTDNTETTPVTAATPGVRADHAFEGDMVRWHVEVDINEVDLTEAVALLEYDANNWFGSQNDGGIKAIRIEHVPVAGTPTVSTNLNQYSYIQNNGGKTNHIIDIKGGDFSLINPTPGDKFIIDVDLKVSEVCSFTDTAFQSMTGILVSSPVKSLSNPVLHTCNYLTDEFGVFYSYKTPRFQLRQQSTTIAGCSEITMGARFSISRYSKIGDLFPNEFRNFATPKQIDILVPIGVDYVPGSSTYVPYPNQFTHIVADPIITYDVEPGFNKYSWVNNGWPKGKSSVSWGIKDLVFKVIPNCNIEDWSYSGDRLGITVLPTTEFEYYRNVTIPGRAVHPNRRDSPKPTQIVPLQYNITSSTPTVSTETKQAAWNINLNNTTTGGTDIPNMWLAIEMPNNNLVPTLWNGATQIPLAGYGTGKYWAQIGTLGSSGKSLEIKSDDFTICGTDTFNVIAGQNCAGYPTDPDTGYPKGTTGNHYQCGTEKSIPLTLSQQDPSINVDTALGVPPATYDFCTIVPYKIDVNNAANGFAYALEAEIRFPTGMNLDQNSGILTYSGSNYLVPAALITYVATNNSYTIDISGIVTPIGGANGLPGVSSVNSNEFSIKFDTNFDCNYVSGSKIRTKVLAESSCGKEIDSSSSQNEIKTNPVNVTQVPANIDYAMSVTAADNKLEACGASEVIIVDITNQGVITDGSIEEIVATIDDAFDYVSGSYLGITNAPVGSPTVTVNTITGERLLTWPMPDGVAVGASIKFQFEIGVSSAPDVSCALYDINVSTRIEQNIDCSATGGPACPSVTSITSQSDEPIKVEKSILEITSVSSIASVSGGNQSITSIFNLKNTSNVDLNGGAIVSAYYDSNANGIYNVGDVLLGTKNVTGTILSGNTAISNIAFSASPSQTCNIILVVRQEDNPCLCQMDETPMKPISTLDGIAGSDELVCEENDSGQLGIANNLDYSYSWSGANATEESYLNNLTVAQPTFTYSGQNVTVKTVFEYTLTVTMPNGCTMKDTVKVTVDPSPEVTVNVTPASCGLDNGEITFNFPDNLDRGALEFSLDNQVSFEASVNDNIGSVTYTNLTSGNYHLWARWGDNSCPVDLGTHTIVEVPEVGTTIVDPSNQIVFSGDDGTFMASLSNANTYQWQVSADGVNFSNISDGTRYAGTDTTTLIVKDVHPNMGNFEYRLSAKNSSTSCTPKKSNSALLIVNTKTVITNRRITYRVKKE